MNPTHDIVIIEKAAPADAEAIFEVQRRTWLATYPNAKAGISEENIRSWIEGES